MKKSITYVAPWLSVAAIALARLASAAPAAPGIPQNNVNAGAPASPTGEDPLVPAGTDPQIPFQNGYYNPILPHDSGNANPGGGVGLPA
jgi:hypothetical protein